MTKTTTLVPTDTVWATLDNGAELPFRPTTAKSGNTYWLIQGDSVPQAVKYGVAVPPEVVGGGIPKHVTILGKQHQFTVVKNDDDKAVARRSLTVKGIECNKEQFVLNLMIAEFGSVEDENLHFNVKGVINRMASGSKKGRSKKNLTSKL